MNIIILKGIDLLAERQIIIENFKEDTVFLLDSNMALYQYIDELKLGDQVLFKLKICREIHNLDVDYDHCGQSTHITLFSELLKLLNTKEITYVTVKGDLCGDEEKCIAVRTQLSDIVQQMVYLNTPLDKVQVLTEREHQNIEKVRKYEETVPLLEENLNKAIAFLDSSKFEKFKNIYDTVTQTLTKISNFVAESKSNDLCIAVAASKKTGKSVVVNSMIECDLSPTNLELATPNNCIYKRRKDHKFSVAFGDQFMEYTSPSEVKSALEKAFKGAQMDKDHGFAIPDMNIGYVSDYDSFSTYAVYDTPGPDLAGAPGHKEAADRAMNLADVIVFAIDYSKYLTDSEMKYLQSIKKICNEKHKFYSLIFTVNKLDLRYDSEGDKSVVRILDFIREKLIAVDPQFRDSIVMGTSALTYFNCIEAVKIDGCEILSEPGNFRDNLDDCIDNYIGSEEMTILNFISKMCQSMRNFHGIRINSLEELKQSSGMPNLLNYISYIARDKARTERINNLLYHIDSSFREIQNLFCFQELEEALIENKDLLAEAVEILSAFTEQVMIIFDESYPDIKRMVAEKSYTSTAIGTVGSRQDFETSMISRYFIQNVEKLLDPNSIAEHIAFQDTRAKASKELKQKYLSSEIDKIIDGVSRKIISEETITGCFEKVFSQMNLTLCGYINNQFGELWEQLNGENNKIQNDFESLLNARIQSLHEAIDQCQRRLDCECGIPFNLEAPGFNFAFKREYSKVQNLKVKINGRELFNRVLRDIDESLEQRKMELSGSGLLGLLRRFFVKFRNPQSINRICYDHDYLMSELYDKQLKWEVKSQIERVEIGKSFKKDKEEMEAEINCFIEYIDHEMESLSESARSLAEGVLHSIDRTQDYKNNIDLLENKKGCLSRVEECISDFRSNWLAITNL